MVAEVGVADAHFEGPKAPLRVNAGRQSFASQFSLSFTWESLTWEYTRRTTKCHCFDDVACLVPPYLFETMGGNSVGYWVLTTLNLNLIDRSFAFIDTPAFALVALYGFAFALKKSKEL